MFDFLIIILALTASCVLTGVLRGYALKRNLLLDVPNSRSSHKTPIPRGGGLAIVLTFLGAIVWCYFFKKIPDELFLPLFGGGALVAGIGLLDDHKHVSASWRLLVHFVAAGLALYWMDEVPAIPFGGSQWQPGWFSYLISILLLVWTLNLFNFMDGIDGIAAIEAISVAGGAATIFFLQHGPNTEFVFLLFLAAGCAGFLVWNWPPAKIFMGDVGSGFLGYILGAFALLTTASGSLSLWVWVILLSVFLVDATVTLLRRLLRGERVYEAHCSHAYQHAAHRNQSHKKVTFLVLCINIFWLFPFAWIAANRPQAGLLLTIIALIPLVILALKFDAGKEAQGIKGVRT